MKIFDSLVASNIRQRPMRSAISVVGVALGVALVMLFTGLTRGMSNDLQRRSTNVRGNIIFTRKGSISIMSSATNLSTKYLERLQQIDGVEAATPIIRYVYASGGIGFDQVEGVEWDNFARMNDVHIIQGRGPQANDEVVIDETKAARKHPVGSTLKIFGEKLYKVVGIYSPEAGGARAKLTLASLQETLEAPGKCTYILIKTKESADPVAVAKRIDHELPGNNVQFTRDVFASVESSIPSLGIFLRVLVALAAIVSALVVMLAMHTTITERTREIGILKAMGASRAYIVGEIEREALLISAMGLVAGFAVALGAGFVIHKSTSLIFEYGWRWALAAAAIGLIGGALGALYPAMRAANLDPVNALAYE
ncbi:MAG TPA: ABC transporter permease [Pyrinomonadaceae bacterium]|nr:ABC transporter permease [Pyrinomonadaceae bacterium]